MAADTRASVAQQTTQLVSDLNSLQTVPRQAKSLAVLDPRGGRPATVGVGVWKEPAKKSSGGGIASPLTEDVGVDGKSLRVYYPDATQIYSNDYLLAIEIQPLKTLNMTDADGNAVVLNFARPSIES